jgi:hypothetical protein
VNTEDGRPPRPRNLVQPEVPVAMGGGRSDPGRAGAGGTPALGLPRPWLLFALVLAAVWPFESWWLSDDLVAVHHASDPGRALADFAGNQYGLDGVVWFYRPLITLSFWFDQLVGGGPAPLVAHLSNALAHALSAVLVGTVAARFVGPLRGWLAGLLWALAPGQAGAVFWAVGRVDSHTMVWSGLCCLLFLRHLDGRPGSRLPALAALLLALCSKEQAIVLPGVLALLAFGSAPPGGRVRDALRSWPAFALVGAYLGFRLWLFGRLGGYGAAAIDPAAAAAGLGESTLTLFNPLRRLGGSFAADELGATLPAFGRALGFAPLALALGWVLWRRRFGLLAASAVGFVGLALPALPFWALTGGVESLRYFYASSAACAVLLAAAGPLPAVLALLVFALPALEQRRDWTGAWRDVEAIHRGLIEDRTALPGAEIFVAGLPRQNSRGTVVELHLGVDRLLQPPFVADEPRVCRALRPLSQREDALRLPYGDGVGLPFDAPTLGFEGPAVRALLPPARLPDAPLELVGLETVATADLLDLHEGRKSARILVRGVRAERFRVSLFTAGGYLSVEVEDRAAAGAADGAIDLRELLVGRFVTTPGADQAHLLFALAVATSLDLEPVFPVLVEALRDGAPTHANRRPLRLRFDRGLDAFVHGRWPPR